MPIMSRRTIEIHKDYSRKHSTMHYLTASGECFGDDLSNLTRQGYTYLRHLGKCWFRYLMPAEPVHEYPAEWELFHDNAYTGEPDF